MTTSLLSMLQCFMTVCFVHRKKELLNVEICVGIFSIQKPKNIRRASREGFPLFLDIYFHLDSNENQSSAKFGVCDSLFCAQKKELLNV
jgi:hypothetical protein